MVTTHVPYCVMTVLLYVFNFMHHLMVFKSLASVTLGNNFWICTRALCYHHSLYLFYMELLVCYCLCTHLILQLTLTNFCSYVQNQYSLFQFNLCCTLGTSLAPFHLLPCSLCYARPSWSAPSCHIPHTSCHTLGTVLAGVFPHNIYMAATAMSGWLEL